MDRHVGKSGKRIIGDNHAYRSVPTGSKKWLKPTWKVNIYTIIKQNMTNSTFIIVLKAFIALKRTRALTF